MKLKHSVFVVVFLTVVLHGMAFAHNITVDGSDVSHKIKLASAYDYIPEGKSVTYDLNEGTYRIYSSGGGYIASFEVNSSGEVSYDPSYDGTVFVGTGTSTITIVGHEITIDGSQVDTELYEFSLRTAGTTQPDGTVTYKLPANVERRQTPGLDEYVVHSYPGGKIAQFNVAIDGTIYFDATYNGIISGASTSTVTVVGYDITIDGTQVDTELYEYGLRQTATTSPRGSITYRLPANPYHDYGGNWGPYALLSKHGGRVAIFQVESDGNVSYEEDQEGIVSGIGTQTLTVLGYSIAIDGTQVDTELYEYGFGRASALPPRSITTYRLPANPYHGPWGPYSLLSIPGGKIAVFQVEPYGNVSYESEYEGVVTGSGSTTLTVLGYPITIDGAQVDTELYEYSFGRSSAIPPGGTATYRLPANPQHGPWGPYFLLSVPGGLVAVFQVEPYGNVSYESEYEGVVTGSGSTTLTALGYPITIDGAQVDTELYEYSFGRSSAIPPGGTATYRLPANPNHSSWGPYYLLAYPGGVVAPFKVEPYGAVSYEVDYEGVVSGIGTATLTAIGYYLIIDAEDVVSNDNVSISGLEDNVSGGGKGVFKLPANPNHSSHGPYYLTSSQFGVLRKNGTFKINNDGSCSKSEIEYENGNILLICGAEVDSDNDGIVDGEDNCPDIQNPDQVDNEEDGLGDACDPDDDNDCVFDTSDNCTFTANPEQEDNDQDTVGDICDNDDDNDGIFDETDNCPFDSNSDQIDSDIDGLGDVCDDDPDGDGVILGDNCPLTPNPDQDDNDNDGEGDLCDEDDDNDEFLDLDDNCPLTVNPFQTDLDEDNIGDACDIDIDGDGIDNDDDNCKLIENVGQEDTDSDGYGDACDEDDDNDGVPDLDDNCSLMINPTQSDIDSDGKGDVCDGDLDGDGVANESDNCTDDPNAGQKDWDNDGLGDVCDEDIDGDGAPNGKDDCAFTNIEEIVDTETGCSIEQLCPCEGPRGTTESWKKHGKYVSCAAKSSESFVEKGLITEVLKDQIVSSAAQSNCGNKK